MVPDDVLVVAQYKRPGQPYARDAARGCSPVSIVSMTTSSGDDLPRDIEFLFSRNWLNVAISRTRCLTIIVASLRLLEVACGSVEDMRLVNAVCLAYEFGGGDGW
jgi:hypothetical protein